MSEQRKATATVVKGKDLAGDLSDHAPGVTREYFYWVGVFPNCPTESIRCVVSFPKVTEKVVRGSSTRTGTTERIPQIGDITILNEEQFRTICERIPRIVVRFNEAGVDDRGAGSNIVDATSDERVKMRRKGRLVTIPSKEAIEGAKARGRGIPKYVKASHDEPAARFMFAVLCENQDNPEPGTVYPPSLEETGLVWPEPLE